MVGSPQKKISFVALDLDGTTLNSKNEITPKTIETIKNLSEKGLGICIATGRAAPSTFGHVTSLNLNADVPVVCYNGACGFVVNGQQERQQIFTLPILEDPARLLLRLADSLGVVVQYYHCETGEVHAVPKTDEHIALLKRYEDLVHRPQIIINSYDEVISSAPAAKMLLLTSDPDKLIEVAHRELPEGMFHVIRGSPDPFFVEFLLPDVCKGKSLRRLCEHLDIPLDQVAAFGDGNNDKEMLSLCGMGVAMKNAGQAAKEAADVVLEWSNDEDGVALHLERMEAAGHFQFSS